MTVLVRGTMAKSGGVLNAICAKLLKGNLSPQDACSDPGDTSPGKGSSPGSNHNGLMEEQSPLVEDSADHICEHDLDTDKENNNTSFKDIHTVVDTSLLVISEDKNNEKMILPSTTAEGRRNRRKNVKPRNIVEYRDIIDEDLGKDEMDAFEINNRDVDFDNLYSENEVREDQDESAMDLSNTSQCDSLVAKETTQDYDSHEESQDSLHGDGVLDLSVSRSDQDAQTDSNYAKFNTPKISNKHSSENSPNLVDAMETQVKKYAHLERDASGLNRMAKSLD